MNCRDPDRKGHTSGVIFPCERVADPKLNLVGHGQGHWPNLANIEQVQRIAEIETKRVVSAVTFRCDRDANLEFEEVKSSG